MKLFFIQFTVTVNNCGRSCNPVGDQLFRISVLYKVKNMNLKQLGLMSETIILFEQESCDLKCGLNTIV